MKRLDSIFDSLERARTTLREIRLLKHFDHPNVRSLSGSFLPYVICAADHQAC
jgi:hypothetical protein